MEQSEKKDLYDSFNDLQRGESPEHYRLVSMDFESNILIAAPHGGNIELGTSKIAREIAFRYYNLYCFEGMKSNAGKDLHLTSVVFDEPKFIEMVRKCNTVVSVHGCAGQSEFIMVGGLDKRLVTTLIRNLYMAGFPVKKPHDGYSGIARDNICNLGKNKIGAQIEISKALRTRLTKSKDGTMGRFVWAVRDAIDETYTYKHRFTMFLKRLVYTRFVKNRLS